MKLSLSVFFVVAVLDCSVCFCIVCMCCCFYCSCSAVVNCTFLSLTQLQFLRVSAEIQSFCWYFFFPRTSLHVSALIFLICCHCVSMSMFPFSRRSCKASYLFLTVSRKVSVVTLSFRESTLCCVRVFLLTSLLFSFIFILSSTRWWSEAASAPLCTLTSYIDLLKFRFMQIWSI